MVSQENIPLSLPMPDGLSLAPLFAEWRSMHETRFDAEAGDARYAADMERCSVLEQQVTQFRPHSAHDLAMQVLMETEHGKEEWRHSFFNALVDLVKNADAGAAPSPRLINPVARYQPTLDMDKCSMRELREISDLMWATSDFINYAIKADASREVRVFLDHLQAFVNSVAIGIGEQAFISGPPAEEDDFERRNWSWLVARAQLQCAEGEVRLEGEGVPDFAAERVK